MTITPHAGTTPLALTADVDAVIRPYEERQRRRAELRPGNKAALFDVLAGLGIATIIVSFDGYGDSGQIESIEARTAAGEVELPDTEVELAVVRYDEDEPESRRLSLGKAIEELAYDALRDLHGGWENNEGAYGEFVFQTAARAITLDYHERYTTTEDYSHEL